VEHLHVIIADSTKKPEHALIFTCIPINSVRYGPILETSRRDAAKLTNGTQVRDELGGAFPFDRGSGYRSIRENGQTGFVEVPVD
jgi:hypothetical protein